MQISKTKIREFCNRKNGDGEKTWRIKISRAVSPPTRRHLRLNSRVEFMHNRASFEHHRVIGYTGNKILAQKNLKKTIKPAA
jgi:hypothetical protein